MRVDLLFAFHYQTAWPGHGSTESACEHTMSDRLGWSECFVVFLLQRCIVKVCVSALNGVHSLYGCVLY